MKILQRIIIVIISAYTIAFIVTLSMALYCMKRDFVPVEKEISILKSLYKNCLEDQTWKQDASFAMGLYFYWDENEKHLFVADSSRTVIFTILSHRSYVYPFGFWPLEFDLEKSEKDLNLLIDNKQIYTDTTSHYCGGCSGFFMVNAVNTYEEKFGVVVSTDYKEQYLLKRNNFKEADTIKIKNVLSGKLSIDDIIYDSWVQLEM